MDIGVDFPGIEFVGEKSRPNKQQTQCHPYLAVELIHVLKILAYVFPYRLVNIEGILSALVAVHSLKRGSAVHTALVSWFGMASDTFQTCSFYIPDYAAVSFLYYIYKFYLSHQFINYIFRYVIFV